jgi:4'-phosphopantetheinyl transferase
MPPDIGPHAPLAAGVVHVWIADLDAADDLAGPLSPEERERARRFPRARDARRWESSRRLLRLLLGEYLHTDPGRLRFQAGEHGKPRLAGELARLRFSVSHSGAVGMYAFALDLEVGVDVERPRRRFDALAVAERACGRTAATRLAQLNEADREREFLRLWVRHEASLKCWGGSLWGAKRGAGDRKCWTMDVEPGGGIAATVALPCAPAIVECRRWVPDRSSSQ